VRRPRTLCQVSKLVDSDACLRPAARWPRTLCPTLGPQRMIARWRSRSAPVRFATEPTHPTHQPTNPALDLPLSWTPGPATAAFGRDAPCTPVRNHHRSNIYCGTRGGRAAAPWAGSGRISLTTKRVVRSLPGVRSHYRFKNRGTESLSESGANG
jgi:hypothetical protein